METVFAPGKEILIATGPRDIIQILEELPDDRRLTIAANARSRAC
jgi:spore maturation protein CgeB